MNNHSTINGPSDPIHDALCDDENYLNQEDWFRSLQDDGIGFTALDDSQWEKSPRKKKYSHITYQRMHYKQLFKLAQNIFALYNAKKQNLFRFMLKNRSDAIHKIGMYIANNRFSKARGDIHSVGQGYNYIQYITNTEYAQRNSFYFLDQRTVLNHFLEMWSSESLQEQLKAKDGDRLRAIGILFQEDMREYIPYILSGNDRSKRLTIDEWTGERNKCFAEIYKRFNDPGTIVTLPIKWDHHDTKNTINRRFESSGISWDDFNDQFNPNDLSRIALNRTEVSVRQIVGSTVSAYNTVMSNYTKNTGGGSGDDADFVTWQERDETDIADDDWNVKTSVYLTVVHMFNKSYDFPLVVTQEDIPAAFQIDDNINRNLSSLSTKGQSSSLSSKRQSKATPTVRHSVNYDDQSTLLSAMKLLCQKVSKDEPNRKRPVDQCDDIEKLRNYIKICSSDLVTLKGKKQKLDEANKIDPNSVTKNELVLIEERIETEEKLFASYIKLFSIQQQHLQSVLNDTI